MMEKNGEMRTWLSRYFSDDQTRHADIISTPNGYHVECFENEQLVQRRNCWEHTRQYAEDCAENWVEGIIE
jgi:hypothetical protein